MKKFKFCIKQDCRTACEAKDETHAWEWLAQTKKLTVSAVKKLYYIKKD
tara:strand:- start:304 stop:450 length:147 start_codon:yes stop_codon:yes gene_type:complete